MNRLAKLVGAAWSRLELFWLGSADARGYALLRMAYAGVVLLNLIDLWPHRMAVLSDAGMVGWPEERGGFSFVGLGDSPEMIATLMALAMAAALALGLGVWPRLALALVFAWQVFCTSRGLPMMHGWDILLRIQGFILLISPLGPSVFDWWRLARNREGAVRRSLTAVSRHGLVLTQIQLAVVYWQTAWLKMADGYWRSGEFFSYYMLSIYSRFPAVPWAEWQWLSAVLTHATLLVEVALPLLLWRRRTRWLGFALGIGLHGSILLTSHIWLFSLAVLVPYLAFLEAKDLDDLTGWLRNRRTLAR